MAVMRARDRFIGDNPFRLLCVGSSLSYQDLRRSGDAIDKMIRAGLPHSAALEDLYGSDGLQNISSAIRGLAGDPVTRTGYRLCWPLDERCIPFLQTNEDVSTEGLAPRQISQERFLKAWITFTRSQDPGDLEVALGYWSEFFADESGDEELSKLLVSEDGVDGEDARGIVFDAKASVGSYILERSFFVAAELWRSGCWDQAIAAIQVVLACEMDPDWVFTALAPVVSIGEDLCERCVAIANEKAEWHEHQTTTPPPDVARLERLAQAVGQAHPAAAGWSQVVCEWRTALAWKMRCYAVAMANQAHRPEQALDLCKRAVDLQPEHWCRQQLFEDIEALGEIVDTKRAVLSIEHEGKTGTPAGCWVLPAILALCCFSTAFGAHAWFGAKTGNPATRIAAAAGGAARRTGDRSHSADAGGKTGRLPLAQGGGG